MGKYTEGTLEEDNAFLLAVLTDIRNKLAKDGKLLAGDRTVFCLEPIAGMQAPTLLDQLNGYIDERT
jgi:hypothetical protein